jgi:hypothetical protein
MRALGVSDEARTIKALSGIVGKRLRYQEPKSKQQSPEWQAATEALLMAAEDRGPLMHAHVGMMLALHGAKPIPEYSAAKEKHWGRRKLKRDE